MQSGPRRVVIARALALIVATIGILVLVGWVIDHAPLRQLRPGLPMMKANTAVGLVLAAIATLAWSWGRQLTTQLLGYPLMILGGLTIIQYVGGVDFGIDTMFAPGPATEANPGRLSPATALGFVVYGASLVRTEPVWRGVMAGFLAIIALFGAYGFMFGVEVLFGQVPGITGMALHTVVGLAAIAVASILLVGRAYPYDLLYGAGPGQLIARRAGIAALVVPLAMGLLASRAEDVGLWGPALEDAVVALGLSIVLLAVVHSTSRATHEAAREALDARDELATANQRLEATVERRTAELREINAELERFVSVVSHDIREPLLVLQMAARRLGRDLADSGPDMQRRIEDIQWAVRNATDLVSSMLQWTRNMGQPIHLEVVDMDELLEDALRDLQTRIEERGAVIHTEPLPRVMGSPGLKQVLQNLIGNAIKYGGEPPRLEVRAEDLHDRWRITVRDNGAGVPPEHAQEIFEPYRRLPGTKQEGIGIGLALVRRIVQAHGGQVGLDSEAGQGATFWFTVPRQADAAA